jgi:hypothetical protein
MLSVFRRVNLLEACSFLDHRLHKQEQEQRSGAAIIGQFLVAFSQLSFLRVPEVGFSKWQLRTVK